MYRFIWLFLLCPAYAQNITSIGNHTNETIYTYVDNDIPINEDDCKDVCLTKCCPGTKIAFHIKGTMKCIDNVYNLTNLRDYDLEIYKNDIQKKIVKSEKTLKNFTYVYSDKFLALSNDQAYDSWKISNNHFYLLENGRLFARKPNYFYQWEYSHPFGRFCYDVHLEAKNDTPDLDSVTLGPRIEIIFYESDDTTLASARKYVTAYAMAVSSFFLILVLIAYLLSPQKRNLPSLMLMTFVSCLATSFLFRVVQVFQTNLIKELCTFIGLMTYSPLWASFTWLNVMSYDLWATICKLRSPRWEPRSKILLKFGWYCVYGFGAPLLLTAFMVGIDYADLSSTPDFVQPHFVTSQFCYFETELERRLYVNVPIYVSSVINIVFFIMTSWYIWQNRSQPGGCGDSMNTKKEQNRFVIYVKLTLMMGVTWVLDALEMVVSVNSWVLFIPDVYNSLVGLFIFVIFACKKDIREPLLNRFRKKTGSPQRSLDSTLQTSLPVSKRQISEKAKPDEKSMFMPRPVTGKPELHKNDCYKLTLCTRTTEIP